MILSFERYLERYDIELDDAFADSGESDFNEFAKDSYNQYCDSEIF